MSRHDTDTSPEAEEASTELSTEQPGSAEAPPSPSRPQGGRKPSSGGSPTTKPSTPSGLTKVSANLTPRSMVALQIASDLTHDNQTDVLNRSVQIYAYFSKLEAEGKLLFAEDPRTGAKERIVLL